MYDANGQYLWNESGKEIIPIFCSVDTAIFNVRLRESTNNNAVIAYQKEYLNIVGTDTAMITELYSTSINSDGEKIWDTEIVPLSLTSSYKLHTAMGNLVENQWVQAWEDNISNPSDYFNTGIYAQNISVDGQIGPLGIFSQPTETNSSLSIFPNPSASQLNISFELSDAGPVQIDLLDINGRKIAKIYHGKFKRGTHSITMEVDDLVNGIYLVRLQSDKSTSFVRLIKK